MLYKLPELPKHAELEPVIAPGVEGMTLIVIDLVLAAELPHALLAVTDTFPEVAPKVTVALLVP
jgi:hypothetical protein